MLKINQRGIAPLLIVVLIGAIGLSAVAITRLQKPNSPDPSNNSSEATSTPTPSPNPSSTPLITKTKNPIKTSTPSSSPSPTPSSSPSQVVPIPHTTASPTPNPAPSTLSADGGNCSNGNVVGLKTSYNVTTPTKASLWGSVTDGKTQEKVIFLYAKGPGNYGSGGGTFSSEIGSLRGTKPMPVVGDGRTYTFRLFDAPDSPSAPPEDGTTIATASFSKTCTTP